MDNSTRIVDEIDNLCNDVYSEASTLDALSRHLAAIGMDKLAVKLYDSAQELFSVNNRLHELAGTYTDQYMRQSEQSTRNMLGAALGVVATQLHDDKLAAVAAGMIKTEE